MSLALRIFANYGILLGLIHVDKIVNNVCTQTFLWPINTEYEKKHTAIQQWNYGQKFPVFTLEKDFGGFVWKMLLQSNSSAKT